MFKYKAHFHCAHCYEEPKTWFQGRKEGLILPNVEIFLEVFLDVWQSIQFLPCFTKTEIVIINLSAHRFIFNSKHSQ